MQVLHFSQFDTYGFEKSSIRDLSLEEFDLIGGAEWGWGYFTASVVAGATGGAAGGAYLGALAGGAGAVPGAVTGAIGGAITGAVGYVGFETTMSIINHFE